MTEQYEEPGDGFFEPPVPLSWPAPTTESPDDVKEPRPGSVREPLAPIKPRPIDSTRLDEVEVKRPEPIGVHRLSKGMNLNGHTLETSIGGGKSADVWQASHPDLGATLVKVVGEVSYPSLETKRVDPATFEAKERTFLDYENFHRTILDELIPQSCGDGALIKPLDMGRTEEGRIFKVFRFLTHEIVDARGRLSRRSKEALEPAPSIRDIKAHRLSAESRLRLIRSVLLAVWQLHKKGIVHGDIKPANILAVNTPNGYVARLIDFDNCFRSGAPFDSSLIGGDETYFSPERSDYQEGDLSDRSSLTTATDVFSLSLVLHEIFSSTTKRPDWTNGRGNAAEKCGTGGMPKYQSLGTGLVHLESLLRDCLRLNPEDRPSVYELLVASGCYLEKDV